MLNILIAVATYNRPFITELCLRSLATAKDSNSLILACDDHSSAYDENYLSKKADIVHRSSKNIGIDASRENLLRDFVFKYTSFELLYITDNDTIHDPNFLNVIRRIYESQRNFENKIPIGLYNSRMHASAANILADSTNVQVRKTGPGISQCYDRNMANSILGGLNAVPAKVRSLSFDYQWPYILNRGFIQTKTSYVEHFGRDRNERGLHVVPSKEISSEFEQDRAINPTRFLQDIRPAVVKYLIGNSTEIPEFISRISQNVNHHGPTSPNCNRL